MPNKTDPHNASVLTICPLHLQTKKNKNPKIKSICKIWEPDASALPQLPELGLLLVYVLR